MSNKKKRLNNKLMNNQQKKKITKTIKENNELNNTKIYQNGLITKEKKEKKYKVQLEKNKKPIKKKKDNQSKTQILEVIVPIKEEKKNNTKRENLILFAQHIIRKVKKIRKRTRKTVIISLVVLFTAITILVVFYNSPARISLTYSKYFAGDTVVLKDGSQWYVVEDSGIKNPHVKLLKEKPIDINSDGKIDDNDKLAFDKAGNTKFDSDDTNNIANYLNKEYKEKLTEIGSIKEVNLLTSAQYINLRERLNLGYEWDNGNWLASDDIGYWWLETDRNKDVYVVNTKGSYVLYKPTRPNYVRPVITKDKSNIEAINTIVRKK